MGIDLMQAGGGSSLAGSSASSVQYASSSPQQGLPLQGETVKLRGLPFRAAPDDVLKFFSSFPELNSGHIYFKRHPDGRPSGEVGAVHLLMAFAVRVLAACGYPIVFATDLHHNQEARSGPSYLHQTHCFLHQHQSWITLRSVVRIKFVFARQSSAAGCFCRILLI